MQQIKVKCRVMRRITAKNVGLSNSESDKDGYCRDEAQYVGLARKVHG